jgi:transcriptional regulator with XRE-family HTH domain
MSLAQRIRDCRYTKGWGPDELAHRAAISRTALYQIESGKTEQPRAGTLRRIAEALSVPTETLLGQDAILGLRSIPWPTESYYTAPRPSIEAPEGTEPLRLSPDSTSGFTGGWAGNNRGRDLERKFLDLLRSPLGESVARIVEESHRLLPARVEVLR